MPVCVECGEEYDERRRRLGYHSCLGCGSPSPVRTIACIGKSGYQLVTSAELKQLDPKLKNST